MVNASYTVSSFEEENLTVIAEAPSYFAGPSKGLRVAKDPRQACRGGAMTGPRGSGAD